MSHQADGQTEARITKLTQIIQRSDGSEVRIVASLFDSPITNPSVDVYVHRRAKPQDQWILCSDKPHPDWRSMSVDEYVQRGRSEMLRIVSSGEILRAASMLGKPMPVDVELSEAEMEMNANPVQEQAGEKLIESDWSNLVEIAKDQPQG